MSDDFTKEVKSYELGNGVVVHFFRVCFNSFFHMNNNCQYGGSLKELREYAFITWIRKKMNSRVAHALLSGYRLFVPTTISLPLSLKRKDICKLIRL